MDLLPIKSHMKELVRLIKQEPDDGIFTRLAVQLEAILNSEPLKSVKEGQKPAHN
ncbi:hypothetical protein ES703_41797 [subsurface metagenome]